MTSDPVLQPCWFCSQTSKECISRP